MKKSKGITLIALVITIVILLILAGVTFATLNGNQNILSMANNAVEQYDKTAEGDQNAIDNANYLLDTYFANSQGKTLGDVYTDDMIGQEISYKANALSGYNGKWIVFGKDSSGNILITTEKPIDNAFGFYETAEKWFTYEEDLNNVCSIYGGTVQGQTVTARSITLDDIFYVVGFTEPEWDIYTFGSTLDYENKKVNFKYPSLSASATLYWQDPTVEGAIFENRGFCFMYKNETNYYWDVFSDYENVITADWGLRTENFKFIWGRRFGG